MIANQVDTPSNWISSVAVQSAFVSISTTISPSFSSLSVAEATESSVDTIVILLVSASAGEYSKVIELSCWPVYNVIELADRLLTEVAT